jgi:protein tyrosine phosphatase
MKHTGKNIGFSILRNGTGKSGVFVAMDYLLQLINNGDTHVDIHKLTQILINNRVKLIENEV